MRHFKAISLALMMSVISIGQVCKAQSAGLPLQVEKEQDSTKEATEHIKKLIEDFAKENDSERRIAYEEIVQVGKPAIPYLEKAIKDSRKNVRWIAVQALGAIGGTEVINSLVTALKDPDKDVRRYASAFMGRWGKENKDAINALRKALWDKNSEVVCHAIEALEQLGDKQYKADKLLVERLSWHLKDSEPVSRESASRALGIIGSWKACKPLVNALSVEKNGSVSYAIKEGLVKISSPETASLLLALLKKDNLNRVIYVNASEVLSCLSDKSINEELLALTNNSKEDIRRASAGALGFPNNTAAVTRLAKMSSDANESPNVRERAIKSLGNIGDIKAVDALDKALKDKNSSLRREAAIALSKTKCPQAVDSLIKALNDSDIYVVMHATQSLGILKDKRATKPIAKLFDRGLEDGTLASNPSFSNLPTVAHHALISIMNEDVPKEKLEMEMISNQDQLNLVRSAWRMWLGLPDKQEERPEEIAKSFMAVVKKWNCSFLTEEEKDRLRQEIRDFATQYINGSISGDEFKKLITAVENYGEPYAEDGGPAWEKDLLERKYLTFPDQVKTFQWMLWKALVRKPKSAEDIKRQDAQHKWLVEYIKTIPARPNDYLPEGVSRENIYKWAEDFIEREYANPLSLLNEAITDEQFENFKVWMERSSANGLTNAVGDIKVRAIGAIAHKHPDVEGTYQYPFDINLPFKDEVFAIWGGTNPHLTFRSNAQFRGQEIFIDARGRCILDIAGRSGIYDANLTAKDLQEKQIIDWSKKHNKGDLAYVDKDEKIITLRGARLAELKIADWFEADRLSNEELLETIKNKGQTEISVKELAPINGPFTLERFNSRIFIAVASAEKRLAVIVLQNKEFGQVYLRCRSRTSDATKQNAVF